MGNLLASMATALDDPHALASPPPTPAPRAEDAAASHDAGAAFPSSNDPVEGHEELQEDEEEEEVEVEELLDDQPMRIYRRLYVGSIDAARNSKALEAARIGCVISVLGDFEEFGTGINDEHPATDARRLTITMEDAPDEPLLERLPAILATLDRCLAQADADDHNVLVHCIAGRSRSPAIVLAWLMAKHGHTFSSALALISDVRPWIDINPGFRADLALFSDVLHGTPAREALDALQGLPRLDFAPALVADVVSGKKRVTMRLPSDAATDARSDLGQIWPHGVVVATASSSSSSSSQEEEAEEEEEHRPFAFLRVDRVEPARSLGDADDETLRATGLDSRDAALRVLQRFYPAVTLETALCVVHFTCLCATGAASA
ncbi:hypothetical protein ATCC90586_004359 [Pythium insidiosum]|nr:hypothetical protein ATCC90586_004359 [Pythium insidiosum]